MRLTPASWNRLDHKSIVKIIDGKTIAVKIMVIALAPEDHA